jgi:carboxypeptidase C (cathepsin A)
LWAFGKFLPFWYVWTKKNLATLHLTTNNFGASIPSITESSNRPQEPYPVAGETVGYLKTVKNLRLFVMRNAGHMVPRSCPSASLDMFNKFISGRM